MLIFILKNRGFYFNRHFGRFLPENQNKPAYPSGNALD